MAARERGPKNEPSPDMFRQTKPCDNCPFRKGSTEGYDVEQLANYASYFLAYPGATFPCHKSVPKDDGRKEWSSWREGQTLCAGGLILADKLGVANGVMAWGLHEGCYDASKLEDRDQVVDSVEELLGVKGTDK